jgi:predicted GH43/DUF377 family glycosyl hydrolase
VALETFVHVQPSTFPYRLVRRSVLMRRRAGVRTEAEGVLNPGSATAPDGSVWLLPRLVGPGNESRVGLARVVVEDGVPVGTEPPQVVLEPEAHWEMSADHAGVEDPRVTWVPSLGVWAMCYVAFGPTGPRLALAVSRDLHYWQRLGPVHFAYDSAAAVDLGVLDNKDGALFPEPVPGPDGRPSYALLHRPVWDDHEATADRENGDPRHLASGASSALQGRVSHATPPPWRPVQVAT